MWWHLNISKHKIIFKNRRYNKRSEAHLKVVSALEDTNLILKEWVVSKIPFMNTKKVNKPRYYVKEEMDKMLALTCAIIDLCFKVEERQILLVFLGPLTQIYSILIWLEMVLMTASKHSTTRAMVIKWVNQTLRCLIKHLSNTMKVLIIQTTNSFKDVIQLTCLITYPTSTIQVSCVKQSMKTICGKVMIP